MKENTTLRIGGLTPFTTADYPNHLACTVFINGCPWRCGYCHNTHLQNRAAQTAIAWSEVLRLLESRQGLIDAIVFSGGEPTMEAALPLAIKEARKLGFKIGLHTAGIYPKRFKEILPLLDWVGFDIKADWTDYDAVTGIKNSAKNAQKSLEYLLEQGIDYECRTTIHPALHNESQLQALIQRLSQHYKIKRYILQAFRATGCESEHLKRNITTDYPIQALIDYASDQFADFEYRATKGSFLS